MASAEKSSNRAFRHGVTGASSATAYSIWKAKKKLSQTAIWYDFRKERGGTADSNTDIQQKLEELLITSGTEPPTVKELCELFRLPEKTRLDHLTLLTRQGRAVKVKSALFYAPAPLHNISETMLEYLRTNGEITPAEFREITGLSRKFMIPVLEYFDSLKMTVRVGDKRLLRRR